MKIDAGTLAARAGFSPSDMSRIIHGKRLLSEFRYGALVGAIASIAGAKSRLVAEVGTAVDVCRQHQNEPMWVAIGQAALQAQHRALRDELTHALSAIVVWPFTTPHHFTTTSPDELPDPRGDLDRSLTVLLSESRTYATNLPTVRAQVDAMHWTRGKDMQLHVLPSTVMWEHELGSALAIVTTKTGETFAHLDTPHAGIFFHRPDDVRPLQHKAQTLADAGIATTQRLADILADPTTPTTAAPSTGTPSTGA